MRRTVFFLVVFFFRFNSRVKLSECVDFWLQNVESKRSVCFQFMDLICDEERLEKIWETADSCHLRKTDIKQYLQRCFYRYI